MNRRLFLILIAVTALLSLNGINNSSVHIRTKAYNNSKSESICNLPLSVINTFDFITEIEDEFSEYKFNFTLNYSGFVNSDKHKIQYQILKVFSVNSQICYTNLYRDVPFYMAIGNYRI